MAHQCELMDWQTRSSLNHTIVRRRVAVEKLPQALAEAYCDILKYLDALDETAAGAPFVAYFNMDLEDMDVAIGFPVAQPLPGRDAITACELPSGTVASCLHTGPYEELADAYQDLTQWVEEMGHMATGVAYEIYLNDPNDTPKERLQTQIVFPLMALATNAMIE